MIKIWVLDSPPSLMTSGVLHLPPPPSSMPFGPLLLGAVPPKHSFAIIFLFLLLTRYAQSGCCMGCLCIVKRGGGERESTKQPLSWTRQNALLCHDLGHQRSTLRCEKGKTSWKQTFSLSFFSPVLGPTSARNSLQKNVIADILQMAATTRTSCKYYSFSTPIQHHYKFQRRLNEWLLNKDYLHCSLGYWLHLQKINLPMISSFCTL